MSKFKVNGTTYEMVQDKVTFAEAKAIEKVTGHSFQEILNDAKVQGATDVTQAFFWVSMKRVDPTLTFGALDDIALDEIEWIPDEDEPGPTQPAEEPVAEGDPA